MHNKRNLISSIFNQIFLMLQGFILPRLFITTFGSNINGLVSSTTQFLGLISLLEGGLGAVVLAQLYDPMEHHDRHKVSSILNACQSFFNKVSLVFVIYTIVLAFIYPLFIKKDYSVLFTGTLVIILSFSTLAQYVLSITNKLFLQAEQRFFVVCDVSSAGIVLNIILTVALVKIWPEIHAIKFVSSIAYLLQPLLLSSYIRKHFGRVRFASDEKYTLKDRWSGFSQNLAHYINLNTDIILITIFSSLSYVSVYSIYMMAINSLRSLVMTASNSYQSALGKYYVEPDQDYFRKKFDEFQTFIWIVSLVLFNTCLLLINPFVSIYTQGVHDANYYQPIFALIIIYANMLFSIREPYRLMALSAGKFKETNFGSFMEAILNFAISIILVGRFNLVGVAIGTFIAILYRFIYFMNFFKKDVLYKSIVSYFPMIFASSLIILLNSFLYFTFRLSINSIIDFILYGVIVIFIESVITLFFVYICLRAFGKKIHIQKFLNIIKHR